MITHTDKTNGNTNDNTNDKHLFVCVYLCSRHPLHDHFAAANFQN